VPTAQDNLKPWEKAFLGEEPLLTTGVFWQCAIGIICALSQIYFTATQLHLQNPKLFSRWWVVFLFLIIVVLYLTGQFLVKASEIKSRLRKNSDQLAYNENLLAAQSLTLNFFRITMGLAIAVIIPRFFIRY
jgi:hypothetical protein